MDSIFFNFKVQIFKQNFRSKIRQNSPAKIRRIAGKYGRIPPNNTAGKYGRIPPDSRIIRQNSADSAGKYGRIPPENPAESAGKSCGVYGMDSSKRVMKTSFGFTLNFFYFFFFYTF